MPPDWITLALVLLTVRWWWALGATLLGDLQAVSEDCEPFAGLPDQPALGRGTLASVGPDSRTPLNRVLAFRGVARRVRARRRWEGGFGRRGL